jgi:hypothetical protein
MKNASQSALTFGRGLEIALRLTLPTVWDRLDTPPQGEWATPASWVNNPVAVRQAMTLGRMPAGQGAQAL